MADLDKTLELKLKDNVSSVAKGIASALQFVKGAAEGATEELNKYSDRIDNAARKQASYQRNIEGWAKRQAVLRAQQKRDEQEVEKYQDAANKKYGVRANEHIGHLERISQAYTALRYSAVAAGAAFAVHKVVDVAQAAVQLDNFAHKTRVAAQEIAVMRKAGVAAGLSLQEVDGSIESVTDKLIEMQKPISKGIQELAKFTGGLELGREIQAQMARDGGKTANAMKLIAEWQAKGGDHAKRALAHTFGMSYEFDKMYKIMGRMVQPKMLDPEQALELSIQWENAKTHLENLGKTVALKIIPELTKMAAALSTPENVENFTKAFEALSTIVKTVATAIDSAARAMGGYDKLTYAVVGFYGAWKVLNTVLDVTDIKLKTILGTMWTIAKHPAFLILSSAYLLGTSETQGTGKTSDQAKADRQARKEERGGGFWEMLGYGGGNRQSEGRGKAGGGFWEALGFPTQAPGSVTRGAAPGGAGVAPGGAASPFTNPAGAFSTPGRATGGNVMGGQGYTVGESGRETFFPGQSGTIVPGSVQGQMAQQAILREEQTGNKTLDEIRVLLEKIEELAREEAGGDGGEAGGGGTTRRGGGGGGARRGGGGRPAGTTEPGTGPRGGTGTSGPMGPGPEQAQAPAPSTASPDAAPSTTGPTGPGAAPPAPGAAPRAPAAPGGAPSTASPSATPRGPRTASLQPDASGGVAAPSAPGTGGGAPDAIIAAARGVAAREGLEGVQNFMRRNGYPQSGAWCGQFAAAVVASTGGTPPKNPQFASNWRNFGTKVEGAPQPGDIAVAKPGWAPHRGTGQTGKAGSHVTIVDRGIDPKTGRFTGLGGNQGRRRSEFRAGQFDFYRGGQVPPSVAAAQKGVRPPAPSPAKPAAVARTTPAPQLDAQPQSDAQPPPAATPMSYGGRSLDDWDKPRGPGWLRGGPKGGTVEQNYEAIKRQLERNPQWGYGEGEATGNPAIDVPAVLRRGGDRKQETDEALLERMETSRQAEKGGPQFPLIGGTKINYNPATPAAMVMGGHMVSGRPYLVGESGPETFLPDTPQAGRGVPANILAQAREVAKSGKQGDVDKFMQAQGYPRSSAWCGKFMAASLTAAGGGYAVPPGYETASNWRNPETKRAPGEQQPGDIAVADVHRKTGKPVKTGEPGSHVTLFGGLDPDNPKNFLGTGGNQGGGAGSLKTSKFPASRYSFYAPPSVVGANGPEMMVPNVSGQVMPNTNALDRALRAQPAGGDLGTARLEIDVRGNAKTSYDTSDSIFAETKLNRYPQMGQAYE